FFPGFIELNESVAGVFQPPLGYGDHFVGKLLQAFVTRKQQWFGLSVFLLSQQAAPKKAAGVKCAPVLRHVLLEDRKTLARERFRISRLGLFEKNERET